MSRRLLTSAVVAPLARWRPLPRPPPAHTRTAALFAHTAAVPPQPPVNPPGAAATNYGGSGALPPPVLLPLPPPSARFSTWCALMEDVARTPSQGGKQALLQAAMERLAAETAGDAARWPEDARAGALLTFLRLCLPKEDARVYNIRDRTLAWLLPRVLRADADADAFGEDLKACGDASEAAQRLYERQAARSGAAAAAAAAAGSDDAPAPSALLADVDAFLFSLAETSKEAEHESALVRAVHGGGGSGHRSPPPLVHTAGQLKWLVRLIRKDLRVGAQAVQVLKALGRGEAAPLESFRHGADLPAVVREYGGAMLGGGGSVQAVAVPRSAATPGPASRRDAENGVGESGGAQGACAAGAATTSGTVVGGGGAGSAVAAATVPARAVPPTSPGGPALTPGVPVKPMLAEAVGSFDAALARCTGGHAVAEVKYDGNRMQVHLARGCDIAFFSRSMKPTVPDKVGALAAVLPHALPGVDSAILDGEVLQVSPKGDVLAFSQLGATHSRAAGGHPALFVFDILYYNGRSLLTSPWRERRALLERVLQPVAGYVELSCAYAVADTAQLAALMGDAIKRKLEGLMIKDADAPYEPNKRRWVKLKRDHLGDGLADTLDLVVLGAYMGRGAYGGQQSVWLLGAHDPATGKWRTVAKVGNGMTDEDTRRLNATLPMRRVHGAGDVPPWLDVCAPLRPDFVIADPWAAPVWEVTSCELTSSVVHTAGVSLRFPRLTRERSDKTPREATTVQELVRLKDASQRVSSAGGGGESSVDAGESGCGASLDVPTLFSGVGRTPATLEQLGVLLPAAAVGGGGGGGPAAVASVPA